MDIKNLCPACLHMRQVIMFNCCIFYMFVVLAKAKKR